MTDKEQRALRQRERHEKHKAFLHEYKLDKGCERCGYKENPYALQFDHIDPTKKSRTSKCRRGIRIEWSISRIVDEMKLCRVLCANCHSIRTLDEENY